MSKKLQLQSIAKATINYFWNIICLPIRFIFSHETVNNLGLRSLRDERCNIVMKYCNGRLLDIGCGNNQLVKNYGHNSIGVDVYDFGGNAPIVKDSSNLPFENESFQTISFVASLNHIPKEQRQNVLKEAHRLLSKNGRILITMISPFVGEIRHKLAWWDPDRHKRGMKSGEETGLSSTYLLSLMKNAGFIFIKRKKSLFGLNNLYIFEKHEKENF